MSSMSIKVTMHPDEEGFIGRECAQSEKYFIVMLGTSLYDQDQPCTCPYCGVQEPHDHFWTKAQVRYAESVAFRQVVQKFDREMKKLVRKPNRRAAISIGITYKSKPVPISYYQEIELEQRLTCAGCGLQYAIFGVFGFCPDCGSHNALHILLGNIALTRQLLALVEEAGGTVGVKLIENALTDAVAAFDGFGREWAAVHSHRSSDVHAARSLSFQNIERAVAGMKRLFDLDMTKPLSERDWHQVKVAFQKRHLLAHRMGVIDEAYVERTKGDSSDIGKRIRISVSEVAVFLDSLSEMARTLSLEE